MKDAQTVPLNFEKKKMTQKINGNSKKKQDYIYFYLEFRPIVKMFSENILECKKLPTIIGAY